VNKQELVHKVTERTGHNQKQVAEIVAALLDTVQDTLAAGGDVQLTGFGAFKTTDKPARSGYSGLAGRVVDTPARTVPVFKAGTALKAAVNAQVVQAA
jgi:DNA-binding protein HU-beta